MLSIVTVKTPEELADLIPLKSFAESLHRMLVPFEDTVEDITKGINYALDTSGNRGGFILVALADNTILGALVMLNTNMSGYVPENLLLYIAVEKEQRGKGTGSRLIQKALSVCHGDVKLHVEHENPARQLYQRLGFVSKYSDMRYSNE